MSLRSEPRWCQCEESPVCSCCIVRPSMEPRSPCPKCSQSQIQAEPDVVPSGNYSESLSHSCKDVKHSKIDDVHHPDLIKPSVTKYGLLRHTIDDMRSLTLAKENKAAAIFAEAECTRYEGNKVSKEVNERTLYLQNDSTDRLKRRAQDVYYWMKDLEHRITEMREETRLLEELRVRTDNAIQATSHLILHIINESLHRRLSRIGIDLTRDDVEEELQKERDMVQDTQKHLGESVAQIREQIGRNRAAKEQLEMDWSDKREAFRIDDLASILTPDHSTLLNYPGVARYQEGMMGIPEWEQTVQRNIDEAEHERIASCKLRSFVPGLLQSLASALRVQGDNVEAALCRRIAETEGQKKRLEHQLKLVIEEIVQEEKAIESIRKALNGEPIQSALTLAQTRLYNRTLRPNAELTRDCPHFALIDEVREITQSQSAIETQLQKAKDALHKLHQLRIELEKEIAVKDNTLVIDRERVQHLRAFYPSVTALSGH